MSQENEPIISTRLFLQYLSGKKLLSEPLSKSCTDRFTDYIYRVIVLENMDNTFIGLS